jgi:hypothetical protein
MNFKETLQQARWIADIWNLWTSSLYTVSYEHGMRPMSGRLLKIATSHHVSQKTETKRSRVSRKLNSFSSWKPTAMKEIFYNPPTAEAKERRQCPPRWKAKGGLLFEAQKIQSEGRAESIAWATIHDILREHWRLRASRTQRVLNFKWQSRICWFKFTAHDREH